VREKKEIVGEAPCEVRVFSFGLGEGEARRRVKKKERSEIE
jgi:hypothetical protein